MIDLGRNARNPLHCCFFESVFCHICCLIIFHVRVPDCVVTLCTALAHSLRLSDSDLTTCTGALRQKKAKERDQADVEAQIPLKSLAGTSSS